MRYFAFVCLVACSTDTFSTGDAGADDASTPPDGNCATSFCSTAKATTCNDFDETSPPAKWSTDTNSGITISNSPAQAESCPNALAVTVPILPVGIDSHGWSLAALGNVGNVTVTLAALLPALPTVSTGNTVDGFAFFALRTTLDGTWSVRLERSADTAWFLRIHQGTGGPTPSVQVPNILLGAWNQMSLTVKITNDGGASVSFSYQTTGGQTANVPLDGQATAPPTGGGLVTFAVGALTLSQTSQPYTFFYDNVVIDVN